MTDDPQTDLHARITQAIADALKPRYGGPQHNTPGGLPLTATAEEVRLHRAQPLADAVMQLLSAASPAVPVPPTTHATVPAEAVCKFEEGCHRVVACAPGCGTPWPTDRASVLREAADVAARWNSDCQNCAVELEVAGELRRLAAETPQSATEKPWMSDGSRIGRALIWSWSDAGHGEFARGYRAAQEEARALLTGPGGTDASRAVERPECRMADEAQQQQQQQPEGPDAMMLPAPTAHPTAATADPAMCPRCKGDNQGAFAVCVKCAQAPRPDMKTSPTACTETKEQT